ncbi:MAG: ABC-2 transporter permease [Peptostreptococcaceae bacterium]
MLNLIKKDFIVSIKSEKLGILKYLLVFIVSYFIIHASSFYLVPIFISYLIVTNTFYNDYKNKNMNFINSIPTSKEDIVYSKYILALITIIIVTIICSSLNTILSKLFFREVVLNDIYYSFSLFLIIVSISMPMYFKFGYHKVRIISGIVSVVVFFILHLLIVEIAFREYSIKRIDAQYLNSYIGPFSKILEYISTQLDVTYINIQNITILSSIIFIMSMYLSLRVVKGKKNTKEVI